MDQQRSSSRRHLLAQIGLLGAGAGLLSGCVTASTDDDTNSITVRIGNSLSETESVTITMVDSTGETIETAEFDIPASASRAREYTDISPGSYDITVAGEGWKTTANWETVTCSRFVVETDLDEGADGTPHTSLSVSCGED